jgi:hypothetical protein
LSTDFFSIQHIAETTGFCCFARSERQNSQSKIDELLGLNNNALILMKLCALTHAVRIENKGLENKGLKPLVDKQTKHKFQTKLV